MKFDDFTQLVLELKLVSPPELQEILSTSRRPIATPTTLAMELIRRGRLTRYQFRKLLSGAGRSLLLGTYLVRDLLHEGPRARLLRAVHRVMKRDVAIRVLAQELASDDAARDACLEHAQRVSQLNHPHLVIPVDAGDWRGVPYFVSEYVAGPHLAQIVQRHGPLAPAPATDLLLKVVRALEYVHAHNLSHGHLQASHLHLAPSGSLQITGLDLFVPADEDADLRALGTVFSELLVEQPAGGPQTAATLAASRPDLPPDVTELFRRLLADPDLPPFGSLSDLRQTLESLPAESAAATAPPAVPQPVPASPSDDPAPRRLLVEPQPPVRPRRRGNRGAALLLAALSIALAAVIWFLPPPSNPRRMLDTANESRDTGPPDNPARAVAKNADIPPPLPEFALEFDGVASEVELPVIAAPEEEVLIVDVLVTPLTPTRLGTVVCEFADIEGWSLGLSRNRWALNFTQGNAPLARLASSQSAEWGLPVRLTAIVGPETAALFVDGELQGECATPREIPLGRHPWRLGMMRGRWTGVWHNFAGRLHRLHIAHAASRQPVEDLLPADPWTLREQTLALYPVDAGVGDVLRDASPHGRDGVIIGARWTRQR